MTDVVQRRVVRTLYRNIFRFCKALDSSAPNAVNGQLVKLSAHLKVSSVYTSLAKSAERSYPQKILMSSENACSSAQKLFRMPLPCDTYAAKQEAGFRMDMAFAALRFLNDRYSHVVEQRNDVVKEKDWANIIKRDGRVEDGAIAIARAADASVEAATVYHELDRIADLVRARIAETVSDNLSSAQEGENGSQTEARVPASKRASEKTAVRADEKEHNSFSLQQRSDQQFLEETESAAWSQVGAVAEAGEGPMPGVPAIGRNVTPGVLPYVMPSQQPDNRFSLLEAAERVALDAFEPQQDAPPLATVDMPGSLPMDVGDLSEAVLAHSLTFAHLQDADGSEVREESLVSSCPARPAPPAHIPVQLGALNAVLFEELGFVGNREDYYDPGNNMIHSVLERRTGNPITLSVVYLAVARRVGLNLSGAECPSHFIVRGENAEGETYFVDVFDKGKVMSIESCKEMFLTARSALLDQKDLAPVAPVQIYSRIMRNLINSHMILGNGDKALLWTERLRVLEQANLSLQDTRVAPPAQEDTRGWRGKKAAVSPKP